MLKKLSAILLTLLIILLQLQPLKANALVNPNELKVSTKLTQ